MGMKVAWYVTSESNNLPSFQRGHWKVAADSGKAACLIRRVDMTYFLLEKIIIKLGAKSRASLAAR